MKRVKITSLVVVLLLVLGASLVFAAEAGHEGEGSPWNTWMLLWRVINTVALIVLLVYFLKKPLVTFFAERKEQISKDLDDAREQRERAERLLKDYEAKIAGMEQELAKMRAELAKASEAESKKLLEAADAMSVKMVDAARLAAEQEVRKAKAALKNEAVDLAVELAEALIREKITDQDRRRIVEDYLDKVGGMK
ncbi:MAG: ATP synthase F0 subunit B [Desulfomonile tiedjei]|nr:ATP synthase F0 subunit B [Desulfomonile tiedjei]